MKQDIDYDIFKHDFVWNPFPTFDQVRESDCPIVHSDKWGGSWLQTWMERIPEFTLVDPTSVTWAGGQVRGPRRCLVSF
jgi:hypothetical protein